MAIYGSTRKLNSFLFSCPKGGDTINKKQIEVEKAKLAEEQKVFDALKKYYGQAANDAAKKIKLHNGKITVLLNDWDNLDEQQKSILQSKIYQRDFQLSLKKQLDEILDNLNTKQYKTVEEYLKDSYEMGFLGTMYDIHGQGIPLVLPIDQKAAVKAAKLDSKISKKLYGSYVTELKKRIQAEVSRGVASNISFKDIARNLNMQAGIGLNKAMRIARTEGHGVQIQAANDAQHKAKAAGADVVKQWDAALDGKTRDSHRQVDGQIRELDEKFSNGMMFPSDPSGAASEVINCRCTLLQRATWALDEDELETLKERAAAHGLDKTEQFDDFKKKYLKAAEEIETTTAVAEIVKPANISVEELNQESTGTLAKLYEKHRLKNGLTSVPYDELGNSADAVVNANYGKMSVESASAFNNTIKTLASEYDTPLQKVRTMNKNEFMFHGNSFAFVKHDYTVDSAELIINPAKCADITKLTDRIKELSEYGYCVRIADDAAEKYIITHEFAHTLLNMEQPLNKKTNWLNADYDKIKKARKEIQAVYDEYMEHVKVLTEKQKEAELAALLNSDEVAWKEAEKRVKELDAVKISDYSLESVDEFLAEAFTNEKIGTVPNEYSKRTVDILDKYFKG